MGFRHYIYLVEKDNLYKLKDYIQEYKNKKDSHVSLLDAHKVLEAIDLLEIGNYSEEGYQLCKEPRELEGYSDVIKEYHKLCNDCEQDFNILNREDIVWLAEQYRNRTVSYWKQLLGKEEVPSWYDDANRTVDERCIHYVEDLLRWQEFMINTDENRPWTLQTTWKYEYELYNILHILKMVDWEKQVVLIQGY